MTPRKIEHAALFLVLFGALLFAPPLVTLFNLHQRILGVPVEVVYLFLVWAGLICGAAWLAARLPDHAGDDGG